MTTLYHPLPESTFATLAGLCDTPGAFADFLNQPEQVGAAWFALPLDQRKWDVLAWFLCDRQTSPLGGGVKDAAGHVISTPRLFPGILPPAALGAWLTSVGDERGAQVAGMRVFFGCPPGEPEATQWWATDGGLQPTEASAWLDLKRRVAAMFGELEFASPVYTTRLYFAADSGESFTEDFTSRGIDTLMEQVRRRRQGVHWRYLGQSAVDMRMGELRPIDLLPSERIDATSINWHAIEAGAIGQQHINAANFVDPGTITFTHHFDPEAE